MRNKQKKNKAGVLRNCGVKFTQLEISKFKEWKLVCQCQAKHMAQHEKENRCLTRKKATGKENTG